jgi:hypothetical protein
MLPPSTLGDGRDWGLSLRASFLGSASCRPRARPFDKTLEQPKRIDPARGSKPTELDQIDSSLPIFDLRDPAMGNAKARGQVALRKPRVTADSAEFRT